MPPWVLPTTAYAFLGAALVIALIFLAWGDRPKQRRRCPRCWYEIAGPSAAIAFPVTCPECGKPTTKPKHLIRTRRRWRSAGPIVAILLLLAWSTHVAPDVRKRGWYAALPSALLLTVYDREHYALKFQPWKFYQPPRSGRPATTFNERVAEELAIRARPWRSDTLWWEPIVASHLRANKGERVGTPCLYAYRRLRDTFGINHPRYDTNDVALADGTPLTVQFTLAGSPLVIKPDDTVIYMTRQGGYAALYGSEALLARIKAQLEAKLDD